MRSILARTDALKAINHAESELANRNAGQPLLDSCTLFAGGSEVVIAHGPETYRLRLTRQSKLSLTK